jgi:hypothetical protein
MISLLVALAAPAQAQDCNAKELEKALGAASPNGVPAAFQELASCDAARAKKQASAAFERVLSGEGGNALVISAIQVGAKDEVRTWIDSLQSDERSRTVAGLGAACAANEEVAGFLTETATSMGQKFWTDRWYRSLAECRNPGIQELLLAEVTAGSDDRTRFFGVLEVYSRNLGKDAIPFLTEQLGAITNDEELTYVVNAFADAAQVGSLNGQDAETTELAVQAIVAAAPSLPWRAVEQSRTTLTSLGANEEADKLAAVRFKDVLQDDGLHWGVVVVETGVCKKDTRVNVHAGEAIQAGTMWPDQVAASIEGAALAGWEYPLAKKCEVTHEVLVSATPLDAAGLETWTNDSIREASKKATADKKATLVEAAALAL